MCVKSNYYPTKLLHNKFPEHVWCNRKHLGNGWPINCLDKRNAQNPLRSTITTTPPFLPPTNKQAPSKQGQDKGQKWHCVTSKCYKFQDFLYTPANFSTCVHPATSTSSRMFVLCIQELNRKAATREHETNKNLSKQIFCEHPNPANTILGQPSLRQSTLHPSPMDSGSNIPSNGRGMTSVIFSHTMPFCG